MRRRRGREGSWGWWRGGCGGGTRLLLGRKDVSVCRIFFPLGQGDLESLIGHVVGREMSMYHSRSSRER